MMVWLAWAGLATAAAPCADPVGVAVLDEALGRAEVAIGALDLDALGVAVREGEAMMACLREPATTATIARWFRILGIQQFAVGDEAAAAESFTAARALQLAYKLDPTLGAPVRAAWDAANPPPESWTQVLPVPAEGWLQVDGRRSDTAPQGRAYVLQWFDEGGAIRLTQIVQNGELPPEYPVAAAGQRPAPKPGGAAPGGEARPSRGLLISGLAVAVAGGASIGAAAALQGSFQNSDEPSSEQSGLIAANRALGIGGLGLAVGGLGLGVTAVVVGRW